MADNLDFHSREFWFARLCEEGYLGNIEVVFAIGPRANLPTQKALLDLQTGHVRICHLYDDGTVVDQGRTLMKNGDRPVWMPVPAPPPFHLARSA